MVRGVPTLQVSHKICEKGKLLTAEQAQLLKLIGHKMVEFRVGLIARWDSESGEVVQIEGAGTIPSNDQLGCSGDEDVMSE